MQDIETFGKYQLMIYALIALPLVLSAGFTLDYVFTAGEVKYRCLVPECEDPRTTSIAGLPWLNHSLSEKNCMRYEPRSPKVTDDCTDPSFFSTNRTIPCDAWLYDPEEVTIHSEWGITCDANRWKLTLVGTINNVGQLVGLTFASTLSDKYGRRTVLISITALAGLSGLVHSFSVNYWMFIAFEFIDACFAAGIYSAGFIYAMEMTGVKKRILGSTIISCIYAIGEMWLGLAAMWTKNWRILMRVIYGPGLLVVLLFFLLPESVRWLLANGKCDTAEKVYRKMARVNKIHLSEDAFFELKKMNEREQSNGKERGGDGEKEKDKEKDAINSKAERKATDKDAESKASPKEESRIVQVSRSPKILMRLLICSFCWLTNTFVYYGLSLNSTEFAGNKYVNFILVTAIEIPGNILVFPLLDRAGRKATLCGSFILSGIFCLTIQFVPKLDYGIWPNLALILYVCGKGCITMAFSTSYVYTTELFPTTLRHSLLGICSMTGRIGSILAPQTPLLAKYIYEGLPLLLFGSMSLTAGLLSLTFPETLGTKLPDTLLEAEQVGNNKLEQSATNATASPV